jgi:hypothetical protein
MTRSEFFKAVQKRNIDPESFALDGVKNEAYVLQKREARWVVFYSERGLESGIRDFAMESDALDHLLSRLRPGF